MQQTSILPCQWLFICNKNNYWTATLLQVYNIQHYAANIYNIICN
jgi:hypothetical protein